MTTGGGEDVASSDGKKHDKRPERFINRYVLLQTVLLRAVRGLGVLGLAWSTVVLLGGFVTVLQRKDFWYITLISLVQSSRVFNALADEQYINFVKLLFGPVIQMVKRYTTVACPPKDKGQWRQEESNGQWSSGCLTKAVAIKLINMVLLIPLVIVVFHPVLVLYFSILVSLERLGQQDYGQEDGDASKANLKPGLVIFYSLAVAQGVLYLVWYILNAGNTLAAAIVAWKYKFGNWGWDSVSQYIYETKFMCLKELSSTKGRNLITYASGLLDSDYREDYLTGARMLVCLIENKKQSMQELLIRSSKKRIQKLLMMLAWTGPDDREIRDLSAKIVPHVAGDISIAQFPGTLESVCSLLEPSNRNPILFGMPSPGSTDDEHTDAKRECKLIEQGFIILEKLSHNRNNCLEMLKSEALVMYILSWICSRPSIRDEHVSWVDILKRSFTVLARLAGLRERHAAQLRRQIEFELNPGWVSGYASQPDIQMLAIATFSHVFTADNSDYERGKGVHWKRGYFLGVILELFLQELEQEGTSSTVSPEVQMKAGEALSELTVNSTNCEYIIKWRNGMVLGKLEIIIKWKCRTDYRAIAADILRRLYAFLADDPKGLPQTEGFAHIEQVLKLLHSSLGKETGGKNGVDEDGRVPGSAQTRPSDSLSDANEQHYLPRLQAALLQMIYDMHFNRNISTEHFEGVVGDHSSFVKLLKQLIEKNSRVDADYHLQVVKWVAILIASMVKHNSMWDQLIWEQGGIMDSLSEASKIMSGADSWMLYLHANQRDVAIWGTSLAVLVQQIKDLSRRETYRAE